MRTWLTTCGIVIWAAVAAAAEPTLTVQLKSIDGLLADFKYLAEAVDKADQAAQLDGLLKSMAGPNGLAGSGIGVARPFGLYVVASPGGVDSPFALMLPVANEAAVIKFLDGFNIKSERDQDGVYSIDVPNAPVSVYARFANNYVYVTAQDKDHVAPKALIAPGDVFTADANAVAAVTARIDRIPDVIKQIALSQFELQMANAKDEKKSGESAEEAQFRKQLIDLISYQVKMVLTEGRSLDASFVVDRKAGEVGVNLSLDGKANSPLATLIGLIGQGKSRFAVPADAAFRFGVHAGLPESIRPVFAALIDAQFRAAVDKEKDARKRQVAEKLLAAVGPTLKDGELDLLVLGQGPAADGTMTAAVALRVRDGKKMETAVKESVPLLIEPKQLSKVHFDVSQRGDMGFHKIETELDADGQRVFGKAAPLWLGIRPEAVVLGIGPDAQALIQSVAESTPVVTPVAVAEMAMARMYPLDKDHHATWKKLAGQVFGPKPVNDALRLSLTGGDQLRFAMTMQTPVVRFLTQFDEAKKAGQ